MKRRDEDQSAPSSGGTEPRSPADGITGRLQRANEGDVDAANDAYEASYADLLAHARRILNHRIAEHTLGAEGLVSEAFLKIANHGSIDWECGSHFIGVMSLAMRQVFYDYEKRRASIKRGGDRARVPLTGRLVPFESRHVDVLALHEAMDKLREVDESSATAAELKYFFGLSVAEVSTHLGRPKRTVERDLKYAVTWLMGELLK